MTNEKLNELGGIILDASIEVHKQLGAGLLESAYQVALCEELTLRKINFSSQVQIDFTYKGKALGKIFVIDI
jgi:GxxExxY protein